MELGLLEVRQITDIADDAASSSRQLLVSCAFFPLLRSSFCLQKVFFHSPHVISMKHVFLQTPEDCRNADRWFAYMPAEYLVRRVMCGQAAK